MGNVFYGKPVESKSKALDDLSTKLAVDSIKRNIDKMWAEFDLKDGYKHPKRTRPNCKVKS